MINRNRQNSTQIDVTSEPTDAIAPCCHLTVARLVLWLCHSLMDWEPCSEMGSPVGRVAGWSSLLPRVCSIKACWHSSSLAGGFTGVRSAL